MELYTKDLIIMDDFKYIRLTDVHFTVKNPVYYIGANYVMKKFWINILMNFLILFTDFNKKNVIMV